METDQYKAIAKGHVVVVVKAKFLKETPLKFSKNRKK